MSELASILSQIATSGWLVRYLGQLDSGHWYAVLWLADPDGDGIYLTPDVTSPDPASALELAYNSIPSARFLPYARPLDRDLTAPEFTLSSLGLAPKPTYTSPLRRKL